MAYLIALTVAMAAYIYIYVYLPKQHKPAMRNHKDIYFPPFTKDKHSSWVWDANGRNFVFQFEPRFDDKGDFIEGWQALEQEIMEVVNGKTPTFDKRFYAKDGQIYYEGDDIPVITIRGWGNLTGTGSWNLPAEEAANIQDTFAEFLIEKLNGFI